MDRRRFIGSITAASAVVHTACHSSMPISKGHNWEHIASQFLNGNHPMLNFNTGSAAMMPEPILSAYQRHVIKLSEQAPYEVLVQNEELVKQNMRRLCQFVGAQDDSIILLRNTTEAINAALTALPFQEGDEILVSNLDYPHMDYTIRELAQTKGVVPKKVNILVAQDSDEEILDKYRSRITQKTKLLIITHMTHREGQILPMVELCKLASENKISTFVDAAHTVGQLDVDLTSVGCDFFASSLHKWMYAPLGTGMLYIKPGQCEELMANYSFPSMEDNPCMSKYRSLGTIAFQNLFALKEVLDYNEQIGIATKKERFSYLNKRLADGIGQLKNYELKSDIKRSCAISAIKHVSENPSSIKYKLRDRHNVHIKVSGHPGDFHLRSSVNLHMTEKHVDQLLEALEQVA